MAWFVTAAFAVASGIASASAERKAGKAARREAIAQAAEVRRQKFDIERLASQQHENRMEQFQEIVSSNAAAAAMAGRTGRSLRALRKREQRLYARDVKRIRTSAFEEQQAREREAQTLERGGREAYKASRRRAAATLINTAGRAADIYDTRSG
jgi:hypothetical protein